MENPDAKWVKWQGRRKQPETQGENEALEEPGRKAPGQPLTVSTSFTLILRPMGAMEGWKRELTPSQISTLEISSSSFVEDGLGRG
jgi:hypothetical protein